MTLGPWYVGDTPTTDIEVHVQRDGADIELDVFDSAEVILFGPGGSPVSWGTSPTIDTAADVVLVAPPAQSPFETPGLYLMYLRLINGAGAETFFATDIRVLQMGIANGWASTADVRGITGESVTDDELARAQGVIELYAGRTWAGSVNNNSIRIKDQLWLKRAVAYQAVWQKSQPGYETRHGIKEVNQDGAQIVYASPTEANNTALLMLGPLARRALKNLSWMRTRSIKIKPALFTEDHPSYGDYKRNDDHPGWRPM
jgi:hypothetical protein